MPTLILSDKIPETFMAHNSTIDCGRDREWTYIYVDNILTAT